MRATKSSNSVQTRHIAFVAMLSVNCWPSSLCRMTIAPSIYKRSNKSYSVSRYYVLLNSEE